jgi:hypothetical protein
MHAHHHFPDATFGFLLLDAGSDAGKKEDQFSRSDTWLSYAGCIRSGDVEFERIQELTTSLGLKSFVVSTCDYRYKLETSGFNASGTYHKLWNHCTTHLSPHGHGIVSDLMEHALLAFLVSGRAARTPETYQISSTPIDGITVKNETALSMTVPNFGIILGGGTKLRCGGSKSFEMTSLLSNGTGCFVKPAPESNLCQNRVNPSGWGRFSDGSFELSECDSRECPSCLVNYGKMETQRADMKLAFLLNTSTSCDLPVSEHITISDIPFAFSQVVLHFVGKPPKFRLSL